MYTVYLHDVYAGETYTLNCADVKSVAENLEYYNRTADLELDEYRTTDSRHLYFDMTEKVEYRNIPDLPF